MTAYEHQAIDHNASIRAEVPDPDQVTITITHGEDEPASITMWAEGFDTMVREARLAAQARMVPADQPEVYDHEPCCDHRASEYGHCFDCYDTGHAHAPEARPATPTVSATAPEGVRTSEGAHGAQGGAGGLGARIRDVLARTGVPSEVALREWADRADELEREAQHIDCAPLDTARLAADAANRNYEWGQARLRERDSARELLAARDAQVERVRALADKWDADGEAESWGRDLRAALATPEPVLNAGDEEAGQ